MNEPRVLTEAEVQARLNVARSSYVTEQERADILFTLRAAWAEQTQTSSEYLALSQKYREILAERDTEAGRGDDEKDRADNLQAKLDECRHERGILGDECERLRADGVRRDYRIHTLETEVARLTAERDRYAEVVQAARAWKAAREHAAEMCARYPHHEQMTTIGPGVWESFTAEHEAKTALDAALARLEP